VAWFAALVCSAVVPLLRTDVLIRRPALLVLLMRSRILNHRISFGGSPAERRSEIDACGHGADVGSFRRDTQ